MSAESPDERVPPLRRALGSEALSWAVVVAGVVLRVAQYASGRSLWVDESFLALNVIDRSFRGLLEPLTHNQAAPLGFLWLEKTATVAFGTGEMALRLVPLLAGVASLVLVRAVARRVLRPELVALAIALFAVSDRAIYYASEVKQYSSDVAVTLAIALLALDAASAERLTTRRTVALAVAGAASVWLSHPAVFALAGAGAALGGQALARRAWPRVARLGAVGAVWIASFAVAYVVSLRAIAGDAKHLRYWGNAFMPASLAAVGWLKTTFVSLVENPVGLSPAWLVLACAAAGVGYFVVENRVAATILFAPACVCLFASALHLYPFSNRLLLFLVPTVALAAAKGVEALARVRAPVGAAAAAALAVALLALPTLAAARALRHPRTHEELAPVLAAVRDRRQPGDAVYLYYGARFPMRYYGARYGFSDDDVVVGTLARRDPQQYRKQLDAFVGWPRVWVIFSHATKKKGVDEERYIVEYLDSIGRRLDEVSAPGSSAYLYDLGEANGPAAEHAE